MAACPAHQERVERRIRGGQPRLGHPRRRAGAGGVAVARDVLDRDPALLAGDPHPDDPAGCLELAQGRRGIEPFRRAGLDLIGPEVADPPQQVRDAVDRACPARLGQALELELEVGHRLRVEQLAQLLGPKQLGQQVPVEGQRLGATLPERRIALVHERAHVVEEQRGGEW